MAASIDATVGGASANSYVTVAEATSYFEGRLNASEWSGASDDEQIRALIMAARRIDQEVYVGRSYDDDQAMQWPRTGVYDPNDRIYGTDEVPERVKRGQLELALALLQTTDLLEDTGLEGFESVQVGSLDVEPRHTSAGSLPANVLRELSPFLMAGAAGVRLQRG